MKNRLSFDSFLEEANGSPYFIVYVMKTMKAYSISESSSYFHYQSLSNYSSHICCVAVNDFVS